MAIVIQNRRRTPRVATPRLRAIGSAILDGLDLSASDLSLVMTDDPGIHELNREWRARDAATDVLSFSQVEGQGPSGPPPVLGDVVISLDTAARQAAAAGLSLDQEIQRLLVHGVLHLLGHDHVHGGAQAQRMRREERRLLALIPAEPKRKARSRR